MTECSQFNSRLETKQFWFQPPPLSLPLNFYQNQQMNPLRPSQPPSPQSSFGVKSSVQTYEFHKQRCSDKVFIFKQIDSEKNVEITVSIFKRSLVSRRNKSRTSRLFRGLWNKCYKASFHHHSSSWQCVIGRFGDIADRFVSDCVNLIL